MCTDQDMDSVAIQYPADEYLPGNEKQDVTLYYRKDSEGFNDLAERLNAKAQSSRDLRVMIEGVDNPKCRGLACWSQSKQCVALTLRNHGLRPGRSPTPDIGALETELLTVPKYLAGLIKQSDKPVTGLVVVAGATGSGKSTLADGLMHEFVNLSPGDHNHIVALGRPVDWIPWSDYELSENYSNHGVRYTPRILGTDTTLAQALEDALRQKTAGVYLDEIRRAADWRPVLRFADADNLIVTTAHAGSVQDMVLWILKSMGIRRRSEAPTVARKIVAVIHVQPEPDGLRVPEIWFGSRGAPLLGAYGPGSLIPAHDVAEAFIARDFIHEKLRALGGAHNGH